MLTETKKVFASAVVTAAVTTSIWQFIDHLRKKKANRIRFEKEREWLQKISNDLRDGKFPLDDEVVVKLKAVIQPLRDQGLLK